MLGTEEKQENTVYGKKMTEKEAIGEYEKITYDVARCVGKLNDLFERCHEINDEMGWDGMFEVTFEDALRKLGDVVSACVIYSLEEKYGKNGGKEEEG